MKIIALLSYFIFCEGRAPCATEVVKACSSFIAGGLELLMRTRSCLGRMVADSQILLAERDDGEIYGGRLCLAPTLVELLTNGDRLALLRRDRYTADPDGRRGEGQAPALPTRRSPEGVSAKWISTKLRETVVGDSMEPIVRFLSSRTALHFDRMRMLQSGNDAGLTNQVILVIGDSPGIGKSHLCQALGRVVSPYVPFANIDCSSLSPTGYVGASLNDHGAMGQVLKRSNGDPQADETSRYAWVFLDEVTSLFVGATRDAFRCTIQREMLTALHGCENYQIGGNRWESKAVRISTVGMGFILAGHIPNLRKKLGRHLAGNSIGYAFAPNVNNRDSALRKVLLDEGCYEELFSRITGVVIVPPMTSELLWQITHSIIGQIKALLASRQPRCLASFQTDAVERLVAYGAHAGGPRAIKKVVGVIIDDLVWHGVLGEIRLSARSVDKAIEAVGNGQVGVPIIVQPRVTSAQPEPASDCVASAGG